jgi:Molybdopterin oxidoreductase Fe4S4 domain
VIEHKPTFCRICEPLCGMVATVEDGRLVALRPDKEHPLSAGFACQKGSQTSGGTAENGSAIVLARACAKSCQMSACRTPTRTLADWGD